MDTNNRIRITILGSEYTIVSDNDESYITSICTEVENSVLDLCEKHSLKPMKATLLAAINLCDEKKRAEKMLLEYEQKLQGLYEQIDALRSEISIFDEEKKYLKNEIKRLSENRQNDR